MNRTYPIHITESGVVKAKASDVLKSDEAKAMLAAVRRLREKR